MLKKISFVSLLLALILFLVNFFFFDFSSLTNPYSSGCTSKVMTVPVPMEPTSKSVLLINLDTDSVIFEKNSAEKLPIASLTKVITALVVLDKVKDLDTQIPVKKELIRSLDGTGSSLSGIIAGEILTPKQLLHCLLITSGNDAALILADYVGGGSVENFVNMMNEKALSLGCRNTHFTNPHGLDEDDHYSTAKDLCLIAKNAMKNSLLMEIASTTTSKILGDKRYPLVTTNSMIDKARGGKYFYKYAKGIKTGYSSKAGKCLISTASNGEYSYLCIVLGGFSEKKDENVAMLESKELYQWAFDNLQLRRLASHDSPIGEVKLKLSWKNKKLLLVPSKDYSVMLPKDILASSIDYKLDAPDCVLAPIKSGQTIGKATLSYANTPVAIIDLVCEKDIKRSNILLIFYVLSSFLGSIWFRLALAILLTLFLVYVVLFVRRNKLKKRKKYSKKRYL